LWGGDERIVESEKEKPSGTSATREEYFRGGIKGERKKKLTASRSLREYTRIEHTSKKQNLPKIPRREKESWGFSTKEQASTSASERDRDRWNRK